MFRAMRLAIATLLSVAITALPVVLDRCAESCEARQHSASTTPPCHHTATTGTRLSSAPTPCAHDHHATATTAAKSSAPTSGAFEFVVFADARLTIVVPEPARLGVLSHAPPNASLTLDRRSLPLRV